MAKTRVIRSSSRKRREESLRRSENVSQPKKYILIVCEGKETEPNYFQSLINDLDLDFVEVHIEGGVGAPITIVNRAIELGRKRKNEKKPEYDEIWCVFDTENLAKNSSFSQAVNKARANKLELAISNPAFEYWYLLHYRDTNMVFADATGLIKELKKFLRSYEKNIDVYPLLSDRIRLAIQRAKRYSPLDDSFPCPSTTVYILIEKLLAMSIKPE